MNMFTKNVKARGRGRPAGETPQGAAARTRLYETAINLIGTRGYEATTLREIAAEAGVSVGLLYRYFPNKQAVVISLYDRLSAEFTSRTESMRPGKWRDRFLFALQASLDSLKPHRMALKALTPVLVGDADDGIFSTRTSFARLRVQEVFERVVKEASDAPGSAQAAALGHLLYLVHLMVLLWWLLDKSASQRSTGKLVALLRQLLPAASLSLKVPSIKRFIVSLDELIREALFSDPAPV
jgi:AcrR family transcriptional regulator